jgi:hypothetical protein
MPVSSQTNSPQSKQQSTIKLHSNIIYPEHVLYLFGHQPSTILPSIAPHWWNIMNHAEHTKGDTNLEPLLSPLLIIFVPQIIQPRHIF